MSHHMTQVYNIYNYYIIYLLNYMTNKVLLYFCLFIFNVLFHCFSNFLFISDIVALSLEDFSSLIVFIFILLLRCSLKL